MGERRKYLKKLVSCVVAVQIDLDTEGFSYSKWGGPQQCRAGDWLVNNEGDVYTVNRESFEHTYRLQSPGLYAKVTPVWAEIAEQAGEIRTKEGLTHYEPGDYLVFNGPDGEDGYAISRDRFEGMYEPAS